MGYQQGERQHEQGERPDGRGGRRKRKRPLRDGWLSSELATLVGIKPRTIAEYCERGLITKPVFRGRSTRYSRDVLIRLLAVKLWRLDHGAIGIDDLRERLSRRTPQQLEAWVLSRPVSPAVLAALTASADAAAAAPMVATSAREQTDFAALPTGGTAPSATAGPRLGVVQGSSGYRSSSAAGAFGNSLEGEQTTVQLIAGLALSLERDAGPAARKGFEHLQREFAAWLDRLASGGAE